MADIDDVVSRFEGKLEPEARDCLHDAALYSIAISLKRIADAIERDALDEMIPF